ncbi:G5 domain-containing protein, partial [Collinsella sp. Sow4_D11]|uniref:G5 domain-containing protein n=1 Tax=Collinsella sp. Sow4_D11 TaxID=3438775 RepID=UPI003F8DE586
MKKHLYTKDSNEYKVLATRGWKQEGIAFYGLTSAAQKITTENLKTNEVLPFKKITKDDKNLFKDESKIRTKGVNGSLERTYKVTYIDGIESKRVKIKETRKEPIDEVTLKGTKDRITTKTETVRSELDFRTTYESDYSMLQGENKIKIKGEKGY